MSDQQVVSINKCDDLLLGVVLQESLDDQSTSKMQREILAGAEQSRDLPVVLDLSNVSFFPSISLGALVVLRNSLKNEGQKLILVGLQPPVRESLAITRLDKLFEIRDDVEAVLAHQRREDTSDLE